MWGVNSPSPQEGVAEAPTLSKASPFPSMFHMNLVWLTLRILGYCPVFPLHGPSSPSRTTCTPAKLPRASHLGCSFAVPESATHSTGASQDRMSPIPGSKQPWGFLSFARKPCQVLVSALPFQQGWGPAGVKGGESSKFSSAYLLTWQNPCQAGPWHPVALRGWPLWEAIAKVLLWAEMMSPRPADAG